MKLQKLIFIFLLFIIIFISNFVSAADVDAEVNNEKVMQDILANSSKILSAQKNVTAATQLLASLPARKEKIQLAIYDIADKTGKRDATGSPVLTQGATDMMITALHRSRQFKVLDRSALGNFMNEQNLVSQERTINGQGAKVGEMLGSEYLITGAITEYQIDKKSAGLGLAIGGKGGQQEYALASCALDIRVINTTSGEVVWARSFKKEIEGKKISFQVFSFIDNNIVEFESGRGKQEVINFVVRTIIEESVFELVQSNIF
ncbi:MAG: CsgG/HfaB family protein [Bacillota bacterium]